MRLIFIALLNVMFCIMGIHIVKKPHLSNQFCMVTSFRFVFKAIFYPYVSWIKTDLKAIAFNNKSWRKCLGTASIYSPSFYYFYLNFKRIWAIIFAGTFFTFCVECLFFSILTPVVILENLDIFNISIRSTWKRYIRRLLLSAL